MLVLGGVIGVAIPLSVLASSARLEARVTLLTMAVVVPMMLWLYGLFGYQRILGLPHVIFWTPLVVFFWMRRDQWRVQETFGDKWIAAVFTVMCISLVIDYADIVRYFLGHRF